MTPDVIAIPDLRNLYLISQSLEPGQAWHSLTLAAVLQRRAEAAYGAAFAALTVSMPVLIYGPGAARSEPDSEEYRAIAYQALVDRLFGAGQGRTGGSERVA